MRTTVTLEKDVERLLREAMHKSRTSFKQALNAAVRTGLTGSRIPKPVPFVVKAKPMGLRAGIDPAGLKKLADDLEIDAFKQKEKRSFKR